MTTPTRDEIAIVVLRCMLSGKAEEAYPNDDPRFYLRLADDIADAVLALFASKREAEPVVRTFGPIGPVLEQAKRGTTPDGVPFWRVLPDPPAPFTQTAGGTPTPDAPKEGDEHE